MNFAALVLTLLMFGSQFIQAGPAPASEKFKIPTSLGPIFEKAWPESPSRSSSSITIDAPTADKLTWRYSSASDSGVELERTIKDKVIWRSHAEPLKVEHSKYSHEVGIKIEDQKVLVTSKGAATINEVIDLPTGRQISREVKWPDDQKKPIAFIEDAWTEKVDGDFLKGEFFDLNGNRNDRLHLRYGPISDSGVEIERIKGGKLLWRVHLPPLMVSHSKYSHRIHTRIRDGKLLLTSLGMGMVFESRDLRTGQLILRKIDNNP
jgi:hypothetical protein